VLRAIDAGASQGEVAETFAVSQATIKRYLKARRETGDVIPKAIPGRPAVKGHCLLVPKEHVETLADLPPSLVGPLFQNAQLLERAIEEGLEADGTFVAVNNRVSQSVPHLHIHLIPRHRKDGLKGFFWPRQRYPDDAARSRVQHTLRTAIARLQAC
jgi:histidine triad (HIT) family protein